jgi:teichuronic acid biosynthesis glycosyltransferase TuaG
VSVVVPCYNAAGTLERTLRSVLEQSHPVLELIVVDDASTDRSAALVEALAATDARIRLIRMPANAGAPAAPRNLGTRMARGVWVAYLDADDIWHPRKLELQLRLLQREGGDMCSTRMQDFRDESEIVLGDPGDPGFSRVELGQQLRKYRTPTSSILVRRRWMLQLPFDEDPRLKAREDTDAFIRIHEYLPHSLKVEYPLVFYRLQRQQISGDKLRMLKRHLAMLRRYRLRDGRGLGWRAWAYTATHFGLSIYLRLLRGTL